MVSKSVLSDRTKTILYWVAIVVLFALFIGFLVAFITTKNKTDDSLTTTTPSPPTTVAPPTEEEILLTDNVVPTHYGLEVFSDHKNNFFNGTVTIDITVKAQINSIRIHCKGLTINSFVLRNSNGAEIALRGVEVDTRLELCVVTAQASTIATGNYVLTLDYSADFVDGQITGFYKSKYTTVDNQEKYLTATKFEPTYARMAFPCFDEPKFKTPWDISIIHPSSMVALSNEMEVGTVPAVQPGFSKTTFKQTVPMVTYLVAFIVSDFKYTETRTTYGTRVRVYSRPDQVEKTRYATEITAQILRYFEDWTGIPYALSKMDLIGLPEFVSGAMENWGLVTYKETYVLYSESDSSVFDQRSIASVITHELAHMWFGNLVTLKWWDHLWLNEGFASYLEYKAKDVVNASWNIYDRFIVDDLHLAFRADVGASARPIVGNVLTPDQITAMFNTISYQKGSSVLNMIEDTIGSAAFQASCRNYLNAYKFGVADTTDLVPFFKEELKLVTGIEGDVFLNKYLYTNSFPILTVQRSGTNALTISQIAYNSNEATPSVTPWNIYVRYFLPNNRNGAFVLSQATQTVQLDYQLDIDEWFKLNQGSTGYYIVNYQESDWKKLTTQLKDNPSTIPLRDRASIVFDAYQLSNKGLLTYQQLFDVFDYLKNENEYLPWSVANTAFSSIKSKLTSSSSFSLEQYNHYLSDLVSYVYDTKVDFSTDPATMSFEEISLQNVLISLACSVDYSTCITQANSLFRSWLDTGVPVNPNIRSYVYNYGVKANNNANDWKQIWNMYQAEKDALEKSKLMSALTSTTSSTLIFTLIKYSDDQALINNENFFTVQQNIASNSDTGRSLVWDYIKNNWEALVARFTLNDRRLGNYVQSVAGGFGTTSRLNEMEDFFTRYPDAGAGASARVAALETVRQNILWAGANEPEISASLESRDPSVNPWLNFRLEESVQPVHYDISLNIDVDNEKFTGTVSIQVNVQKPIEYLILHSNGLSISASNVYTQADRTLVSSTSKAAFAYEPNQLWAIPMEKIISSGAYIAELSFSGNLSQSLNGLYLSQYVSNEGGQTVKLATTQFQAGYARKAFPCFDEPQYKATFTISITNDQKYNAISNMPVDYSQTIVQNQRTTVFKQSVRMSTYLVAMVVSDFVSKRSELSSDFSVYTYNPSVNLDKVDYALTVGPKILDYFAKDYFKIAYPLPKTDMISIPDFSAGAMENWGLVTYRDVYILYDEAETSSASKMSICQIIAHELAHMWYGNLVTVKWWDNLWLNEGFAQFMQYKATAAVEPTWKYQEHFVIKELNRVFDLDSALSTRSILRAVRNENDMQSIFDGVTYAKGASVLRMLENTIGEENFRQAVTNYLNKYSYNNTVTEDLWAEFTSLLAGQQIDVANIMDTWVRREGFPVVTITGASSDGTFNFRQERFHKDYNYANSSYTWFIPLTYQVIDTRNSDLNNPVRRIDFDTATKSVPITDYTSNSLVKFNIDQTGVFILNYPTAQWEVFISQLNDNNSIAWQKLSTLDRNNLLNDAFYLSRSDRLSYDYTLRLAEFLKYERTFIVWQTANVMFSYLRNFAITQDQGLAFNQWLLNNVIGSLYEELGWESSATEDANQKQLRALILNLACQANHEACLATAKAKFDEFQSNIVGGSNTLPDPDTFNVFLMHSMRTITSETDRSKFDFVLTQYQSAQTTNEKVRFLQALCSVQSPVLLQELVTRSLDTTFLRAQDYFSFLTYLGNNPVGLELAWKTYRDNYPTLVERYGLDSTNLGGAIYRFSAYFSTDARRQEVAAFYAQYPNAGASALSRAQALELIEANIQWSSKFYNTVIQYLTTRCDSTTCPWNVYRLTDSVLPQTYHITIQVNTNTFVYNGTVQADVNVVAPVNYIIVHAANILKPSNPSVKVGNTEYATGYGFVYNPLEFYIIQLNSPLPVGTASIQVGFEGSLLLGGEVGLYRGWYQDPDTNQTTNLAATQFESTHARKVFPFFDEPHFKQEIYMTVVHEEAMTMTLTNMPIVSTVPYEPIPGWVATTYDKTVKMVTYLIAILVSDFKCTTNQIAGIGPIDPNTNQPGGVAVSTCASKVFQDHKHGYSLEVTPGILKHYETYLSQPYQIKKLDQVALPQFSPGAMENWGLVKYREAYLLWTDDEETSAQQRSVVNIIAHELAHMWFGNLLTCDFWGELWLNEAFASYMEYSAVAAVHPEWNYFDSIVYYDVFSAMLSDSSESSQPIVRDVATPALMSYASAIVYNKGSSVLHMFNNTIGHNQFQTSLRDYLRKNEYTSVVTDQLFTEFAANWNHAQDAQAFLRSWTYQAGFPYLNITYNAVDQTYSYTQQRFLQTGAKPSSNLDHLYVIPFVYYTMNSKTRALQASSVQFLTERTGTLPATNILKINPDFNSFYLVNYPADYWTELSDKLLQNDDDFVNQLMVNDRADLLVSSFFLARANLTPYLTPFKLFTYLINEKNFVPWYFYDYAVSYLALRIGRTEYRESFNQFERRLSSAHYTGIDFWDDSQGMNFEKVWRSLLITINCRSGSQQCLKDAYTRFTAFKQSNGDVKNLPPNLRTATLCYGVRASTDPTDYEFVWNQYIKEDSSPLKPIYLQSISFISDWNTLESYINSALDESIVTTANFVTFFNQVIANYAHELRAWDYFADNYSMFSRKLTATQVSSIVSQFATYSVTAERKAEISAFLNANPSAGTASGRTSALATVDSQIEFMRVRKTEVGEWLTQNACGDVADKVPQPCPWGSLRIEKTESEPTGYNLVIQVNVTTFVYNGTVAVSVKTSKSLDFLTLNAATMLDVGLLSVTGTNGAVIPASLFRYTPGQYVVVRFDARQPAGEYVLNFNFTANLLDGGLSGLYLSNYTADGQSYGIASTQFEFYDARKVFPTFDEPAFKTTFKVTIIHDAHMNATLSNMDVEKSAPVEGMPNWIQTEYQVSLPMPSYLVAMLVSDFVCAEYTSAEAIRYKICAARNQQHKLAYALDIGPKALEELEKLTGVPSPIKKVDQVAIPDFYYGAMENWGLVTYRETALLFHEDDTTSASKMSITSTIAHELAHFWFGNLVTCEWWDNLWLNESFATIMASLITDLVEPTWNYMEMFLMNAYETAISGDSVDTVHPVIRPITATVQIDNFVSSIVYSKGAAILRMLRYLMTEQKWNTAVSNYLKANEYKTARETDLITKFDDEFTPIDGVNTATELLEEWIKKSGYPYVNVSREADGYHVKQERYLLSSGDKTTVWKIPLSFYDNTQWNAQTVKFLTQSEGVITGAPTTGLVKFNPGHFGFYLTNYSPELWNQWIDALVNNYATTALPYADRAGLVLDSFYLARANLLPYTTPLKLARYLINEDHITPWTIATRGFNVISKYVLLGSDYAPQFQQYIQELVKPTYERLGWDDSVGSDTDRRFRALILDYSCDYNYQDCLTQAASRFNDWKEGIASGDSSKIPRPNLISTVLKYGLKANPTNENWQFMWSQYLSETSATRKSQYLTALANTPDQSSISTLLNQAMEATVIRSQDSSSVITAVINSRNQDSLETVWQFYKTNYVRLASSGSPLSLSQLGTILNGIANNHFFTAASRAELESFYAQYPNLGLSSTQRTTALNTVSSNIAWLASRLSEVENFLLCNDQFCPFTIYRLSQNVYPERYDLKLRVDLENARFEGSVSITTDITGDALNLKFLNVIAAPTLNITSSRVVDSAKRVDIPVSRTFAYRPYDFWVLELEGPVQTSKVELQFEFNAPLNTDMTGFYLSEYYNPTEQRYIKLASTQFQALSARKAFPCFDEPSFKAVFHVTLTYDEKNTGTMSNTQVLSTSTTGGLTTTEFNDTPKMVTYLLAFVVSDFICVSNQTVNNMEVRICSTPPQIAMTSYANGISAEIVDLMSTKFEFKYEDQGLGKMDIVAIPDFSAGAMENWGLLTFRETALLWGEDLSNAFDRTRVASVVAHEITHMWFGNLVTCYWWADLWINEAFASYMEWWSVADVEPEWDYHQQFYITDFIAGLNADASTTAHPLVRVINTPAEVPYITNIIYQKGSSVLRMFEYILTAEKFYPALGAYLNQFQFQAITSDHVIEAFSAVEVPKLTNTTEFVESYTRQAGIPFVSLTKNADGISYTYVQERFFANGRVAGNTQTWVIPLSYYTNYVADQNAVIEYLTERTGRVVVTVTNANVPVKFNKDSLGYYIVNYPEEEWQKWIDLFHDSSLLQTVQLTSQDFSHTIYDAFRLSGANLLHYNISLDLTALLHHNEMFSVWYTGATVFNELWPYYRTSDTTGINSLMQSAFQTYSQYLVRNIYNKLGLQAGDPASLSDQRTRSEVTAFACAYGLRQCLLEAQVEFKKWRTQVVGFKIAPNVRPTVFRYAIESSSDESDWHYLWDVYAATHETTLKLDYLQGLAQTPNRELLNLLFDRAMDQSLVRRQDYISVFSYAVRTQTGFDVAWAYYTTNYQAIRATRLSAAQMGTVANYFARYLFTTQQKSEFQQFFANNPDTGITTTSYNQAIETIDNNINWANTYRQTVYDWLRTENGQSTFFINE